MVIAIAAITFLLQANPFFIYDLMEQWLPDFWNFVLLSYGLDWQMRIVATIFGLIPVVPFLILLVISIRVCLRDVAYSSELIPAEKTASGSAPA